MGWNNSIFPLLIITSGSGFTGEFVYSPAPGNGNLIASITAASGTDPYGNAYLNGTVAYTSVSGFFYASQLGTATGFNATAGITFYTAPAAGGPWTRRASMQGDGNGNVLNFLPVGGSWKWISLTSGGVTNGLVSWYSPSGDQTGTTDRIAINSALGLFPEVHLLPGTYFVDVPVVVPNGTALFGPFPSSGTPGENFGAGGLPLQGAVIKAVPGFAGAAVISLPTPVPNTNQGGGQVIQRITIDGSNLPGGNTVNGIQGLGFIAAVTMRDVLVYKTGGDGLFLNNDGVAGHNPDGFDVAYCKFALCGASGAHLITLTDSVFTVVECSGNGVSGWRIDTGFNTRFVSCGGDSNGGTPGAGFEFIGGFLGYTGTQFVQNCSSELNKFGYSVTSTGGKVYLLNSIAGSNTTAPFNYSGTTAVSSSASFNTSTASPTLDGGPTWQAMSPLVAGFAAGTPGPRFELEGFIGNRVRLTGLISLTANQVAGTTFFTLPTGFRPATDKHVAVRSNFGGGLICLVDILATGALVIQTAGSTGQLFSLDSVSVELD